MQDEERKAWQERERGFLNRNHRLLMHEILSAERRLMDPGLILVECRKELQIRRNGFF